MSAPNVPFIVPALDQSSLPTILTVLYLSVVVLCDMGNSMTLFNKTVWEHFLQRMQEMVIDGNVFFFK